MHHTTGSRGTPTLPDGKAIKLRASCDVCNESKVRCSQTKPTCARCEKQGLRCVYGLSRRSHKTAPRIGASTASRANSSSGSSVQDGAGPSNDPRKQTSPGHATHSPDSASPMQLESLHDNRTTMPDHSGLGSLGLLHDLDMGVQQSTGDINVSAAPSLSLDQIYTLPTMPPDFFDHPPSLPSPGFDCSSAFSAILDPNRSAEQSGSEDRGCNCSTRVITQLLSIPLSFYDGRTSFDLQLSELKRAIKSCGDCIQCECALGDEMTIMTLSILVGRIVQCFETTLPKPGSSPSSASQCMTNDSSSAPKLSWGVLQIEDDDEDDLKQHLWVLHFRKLESLLKQLSTFIRLRRSAQNDGNSVHVMACEFILMWLEQRAQVVREKFAAQGGAGFCLQK